MSARNNGRRWDRPREAQRYSNLRDLSVVYEGDTQDVATRLPDLSARGMFINTNRNFPQGAVLNVRFRLAQSGIPVRTRCEVRYCLPGVGVGVEFVDISPEAAEAIEQEIKSRQPRKSAGNSRNSKRKAARPR